MKPKRNWQYTQMYICRSLNAWENVSNGCSERMRTPSGKFDAQYIRRHVIFMVINISCIQHWINIESKPLFVPISMIWSVPNRIFVLRCSSHTADGWPHRVLFMPYHMQQHFSFASIDVGLQKQIQANLFRSRALSLRVPLSLFSYHASNMIIYYSETAPFGNVRWSTVSCLLLFFIFHLTYTWRETRQQL